MNKSASHIPTPQQTLMNPLNSSSSKFQFSFTKAQRFYSKSSVKNRVKKQDPQYHYYDIPSTNNRKAPTFGVGQKGSVFKVSSEAPPATTYTPTLLDDFDHYAKKENKKNRGYSFSTGRENVKNSSFIQKNLNPGPGRYNPNPQKIMDSSFYGYSLTKDQRFQASREQTKSALDITSIPGPGHYEIKSTLGGQNKILSQDKNNNPCPRLTLPKNESRRMVTQPQRRIYNPLVTKNGDFITFNKRKGFTMGKSLRSDFVKGKQIPGPGKYGIFSQFISTTK